MAVRANPNSHPSPKAVGVQSRPWGQGQGHGGVAKAVVALPRPWGRGQSRGGVAKAMGA